MWQAFKCGNEQAFSALYQRYVRILFSYGKKLIRDEKIVEDAIQDLFTELWQRRAHLGDAIDVRFYLFRCLRRKIHKSLGPDQVMPDNWEETYAFLLPVSPSRESEVIGQEMQESQTSELMAQLKKLPLRQYEVLLLYYFQNFSYAEIADLLAINEQSARNLLQRALTKLRQTILPTTLLLIFLFFTFFL